jgi:hypothetical protein
MVLAADTLVRRSPMKRYRVIEMDFDARANILSLAIDPSWKPELQEEHRRHKESVLQGLMAEVGPQRFDNKVQNFVDMGPAPFSGSSGFSVGMRREDWVEL